MKTIHWGMIGCGAVAEIKSGPALYKTKHSKLVAVMRRDLEKAKDYAKRHNVSIVHHDAFELIADEHVNAIYIATPPSTHKDYALLVAKAKKPIYVEKPMALNYQECIAMNEAAKANNVPLFVAYYRRALPRFLKIKDLLDRGIIGTPRTVNTFYFKEASDDEKRRNPHGWRLNPSVSGGGHFHDLACHTFDILDFLLGPIQHAEGSATNHAGYYDAPDLIKANFIFSSGVYGTGHFDYASNRHLDHTEIIGPKGKITFSTFGETPIHLYINDQETLYHFNNPKHIQQPLIESIVKQLRAEGTCPSTGESAARTSWVMDQITK